jgi:hypothetical protein
MKAVLEVCQAHHGEAWRFRNQQNRSKDYPVEQVRTPFDHSALFWTLRGYEEFRWMFDDRVTESLGDHGPLHGGTVTEKVSFCSSVLADLGYTSYYADITTPDVLECGYRVVRVLVPGLQPIHFGYKQERLAGERLSRFIRSTGNGRCQGSTLLNRFPHPLS